MVLALALVVAAVIGYVVVNGTGGSPAADTPTAAPEPAGWSSVWRDDFNGPAGSLPDPKNWLIDTGTGYPGGAPQWGTGEVQRYTADPANVHQDGQGHLLITPLRDAQGGWTSARIETRRTDFRPAPGTVLRMEARLQLPQVTGQEALGYWPSFWALGAGERTDPNAWPRIGEFDVFENVNGDDVVHGTMHCGEGNGGPCHERTGLTGKVTCPDGACHQGFHTYTVEWDRRTAGEEVRWYLDGRLYWRVRSGDVSARAWRDATTAGDFLLLNVAMGGQFPDALVPGTTTPTAQTKPGMPMVVDYVDVSQSNPGTGTSAGASGNGSGTTSPQPGASAGLPTTLTGNSASTELPGYDFGADAPVTGVTVTYQASAAVKLELRTDDPTSHPMVGVTLPAGAGTVTMQLHRPTKGVHDLYLTLVAPDGSTTLTVQQLTFSR